MYALNGKIHYHLTAKSTSILRSHLKSKHNDLYEKRMYAVATSPFPETRGRKRKIEKLDEYDVEACFSDFKQKNV